MTARERGAASRILVFIIPPRTFQLRITETKRVPGSIANREERKPNTRKTVVSSKKRGGKTECGKEGVWRRGEEQVEKGDRGNAAVKISVFFFSTLSPIRWSATHSTCSHYFRFRCSHKGPHIFH